MKRLLQRTLTLAAALTIMLSTAALPGRSLLSRENEFSVSPLAEEWDNGRNRN